MLRLKLELLYRGLSVEEARAKYAEIAGQQPVVPPPIVEAPKRKRRVVRSS